MKKKLFSILLILLIVLSCFYSNSYAVNSTYENIYTDPYEYMRNDLDIVKNWMKNNFKDYYEFYDFLYTKFSYVLPNSNKYVAVFPIYTNNSGDYGIYLYSLSNIQNYGDMTYYSNTARGFRVTSPTIVYINTLDSALADNKYIRSVETSTGAPSIFIGYYALKFDYLFSNVDFNEEINNNLSEIATSIEDTQNYLSDNTAYSDEELSTDKSSVTNVVQPEIDNLNESSFFTTIYGFYNRIIDADSDTNSFKKDSLFIDFYIFNTHVTGTLERNYTNDLLLRICNNDTVTRNMIRNLIRSIYYLIFFLYFGKKYIEAFHKIITANFDGFHSGVELINAL